MKMKYSLIIYYSLVHFLLLAVGHGAGDFLGDLVEAHASPGDGLLLVIEDVKRVGLEAVASVGGDPAGERAVWVGGLLEAVRVGITRGHEHL